ncbi:hypothetical protein SBRCBS47491_001951 [Sporothrix bragantina]|uniref:Uncharacterized protein n=1 Tax=Sporothrix bragantina TaxID=671064 RepID=A0ABP0B2T9_9PEZI
MPKLLTRGASGAAGAASGGSGVSLGVIIAVVVIGTIFLAVGGGLLCAWVARRKRRQRRQSRRQEEEEARKKQMMAVSMMRDSDEGGRPADRPISGDAGANAAAAAATNYFRPGGQPISDCSSSTCCSLASTRDSFSTLDGEFEGAGVTWWWLWNWRRFWHNQRRWVRRQKERSAVVLGRTGSNSSSSSQGNEIKQQSQRNRCQHDHGYNGHHHHRRGTVDGSPRKLRRRRPETSIIASTNSLFFPAFVGENDNNGDANASHAASGEIGLRAPPPTFSIIRANSVPQRPPPPSEQLRLLPPHGPPNGAPNGYNDNNRSSMPNMPPQKNARYHPQQHQLQQQVQSNQMMQQGPSLQPPPPISTRTLPRPPQPALIIPNQPKSYIPPGVPFHPSMPPQQQHQMMIMMMQQQQMQLQQQIRQQYLQQQQMRQSRPGSKHIQTLSTDTALTEILRSTEQRLAQLQGQQPANLGSMKRMSTSIPPKASTATTASHNSSNSTGPTELDRESVKRSSQTSNSDADSMVKGGKDERDTSPIVDAIPTALSSPSKSPNKNRVAAGTLAMAGNNVLAHPMMLPAPVMLLPQPATSMNSSPETRSPSSVYSSSGASSRSSLSTVYSVDERSDKGTVASKATSKGGVRIANSDDEAQNDRILAGLGITGNTVDSQFVEATKKPEDLQVMLADTALVPAALATPKSRASRGMSVSAAAVPDLPPRSPKRSGSGQSMPKGSGIMIPHSSSSNNLNNSTSYSNMSHGNINMGANRNNNNSTPNRHRRNGSVWQQAPSPQQMQQYNMLMNNGNVRLSFNGGSGSRPNSGQFSRNSTVRLMVTSPSKPNTASQNNNMNIDAADLSDEKTPTSETSTMDWRNSMVAPSSTASSPNRAAGGGDRSLLQSSPTLAPEDEHSLVPGRANPRTSWGSSGGSSMPPHPPKHGRRSLNERIEALQAVQNEEAQFRRSVRPLPRPPSFGSLNNLNAIQQNMNTNNLTVVAAAAELRRMNSTAYSEASSVYSNATSATSHAANNNNNISQQHFISTAPSAMGLTQPRRAGRRRNSSAGESASGAAQRNSVVGSRQYLALGQKRISQVPSTMNGNGSGSGYDKENRDVANKRSSAPPTSSRPAPQRSRSTKSMTTTGTALRRVDENPASGASTPANGGTPSKNSPGKVTPKGTPKGTPSKGLTSSATAGSNLSVVTSSPSTPKTNTGRPLRKSPSRSTQVGSVSHATAAGSPMSKLRTKSMMNPSTPTRNSTAGGAWQPTSRDSLGLYDQDGFLLSSPSRK